MMPTSKMQVGDIVRSAREARGWSQPALAKKIAVSKQTVLAVEKNQRNPSYEVFCQLVHALDISADLIVYPDRVPYTVEQEQLFRELLACNEREQKIAIGSIELKSTLPSLAASSRIKRRTAAISAAVPLICK